MTGGSLPAQTWHEIMAYAHQGIELKPIPGLAPATAVGGTCGRTQQGRRRRRSRPRPTMLTKRGADVLVRVERLMDDATRALATRAVPGKTPMRRTIDAPAHRQLRRPEPPTRVRPTGT